MMLYADNYIREKQMHMQKELIQRVVGIRISYLFECWCSSNAEANLKFFQVNTYNNNQWLLSRQLIRNTQDNNSNPYTICQL